MQLKDKVGQMANQELEAAIAKVDQNMKRFNHATPILSDSLLFSDQLSSDGSWTAGFWFGMVCLAAIAQRNPEKYADYLHSFKPFFTRRIRTGYKDHDLGFLYQLYAVNAYRLTNDLDYLELAETAARCLFARFNPRGGYIRAWGPLAMEERDGTLIADCMMNLPLLFIRVTCRVTNTGKTAGKQVVQLYCEAPQGKLGKPRRVLCAFAKTRLLAPGEHEDLALSVEPYLFASYDDEGLVARSAYVLEKGSYLFYLGDNVRDAQLVPYTMLVEEDWVVQQLKAHCVPHNLHRRLRADGTFSEIHADCQPADNGINQDAMPKGHDKIHRNVPDEKPIGTLMDVYTGKITMDEMVNSLNDEQLLHLLGGQPSCGIADADGFGNLRECGIPNAMTADGPAGVRVVPDRGVTTTAFPCATLLCCTWNPDILEQIGRAGAREMRENGLAMWLAPAMNIHRTPLCGRNFEYYSEDPLLSGKMGAAMVRGIQSLGVASSVKHFCCNNKETNRRQSDSRLSERALREIYLKGFEICVKEAHPFTIMSGYNLVNGVRNSQNRELLTDILRGEWGFDGLVTTDWWTYGEQWKEIAAGNDLKMPVGVPDHTLMKLKSGELSRDDVDCYKASRHEKQTPS